MSVPPNLQFEVDDIEENWTYSAKFDFIHGRMLTGSIQNWPRLIEQSYKYRLLHHIFHDQQDRESSKRKAQESTLIMNLVSSIQVVGWN